ncbi:MAG: IS66 family transposase [Muribaculaceae bacterium]|nr:IS66 family transposase [Muribaculaceae bacterium]
MKATPTYEELLSENTRLKEDNRRKDERIAYLERMLYGAKSDRLASKVSENQPGLFDQLFKEAMDEKIRQVEKMAREIEKEAQRRRAVAKKPSSRPSSYRYAGLEERVTTLMPEGVEADQCDIIGKDVIRILHREPAKVWVEVIERPILRVKADKNAPNPRIYQAKAPQAIIGGNHVGADMLAQIVIDKYRYHLPEYRQIKQYADLGVKLPASTINDWVHAVASKLNPLYEALRGDILGSDYLQIDEVPWRIADTPGKSRKGYAWQFHDSREQSHGLYFLYMNGSRAGTIPRAELRDFRGAIQTDGYGVYDYFELQDNVTLLGCMAHVRRKFTEAQNSHPQLAAQAMKWIELLYTLEANLKAADAGYGRIAAERQSKAMPIMDAMEKWMEQVHAQCTPSDPMGKALDYAYKLWPRLRRYALDGRYHIDNNAVERMQRPSVMGRKNYLFSKSDSGAVDNTIFYSLIESCETVGIEPLKWLTYVLENLHDDTPPDQIILMLPYYYKKSQG